MRGYSVGISSETLDFLGFAGPGDGGVCVASGLKCDWEDWRVGI